MIDLLITFPDAESVNKHPVRAYCMPGTADAAGNKNPSSGSFHGLVWGQQRRIRMKKETSVVTGDHCGNLAGGG